MKNGNTAAHVVQAESLLRSLKGVQDARVHIGADGRIARIVVICPKADERTAARNVHSALFAVLGMTLEPGVLFMNPTSPVQPAAAPRVVSAPVVSHPSVTDAQVVDIGVAARRTDLNEAARVAFDTLRAAQSSFHGFVFDGAELVRINGAQFVVVSVHRKSTDARYCGAAPVIDSVSTASARALMNAVGLAAMGSAAADYAVHNQLETLNA
ncbi:MAG TPA: hypothetical protein VGD49_00400 [Longimicrobiales bacterium]